MQGRPAPGGFTNTSARHTHLFRYHTELWREIGRPGHQRRVIPPGSLRGDCRKNTRTATKPQNGRGRAARPPEVCASRNSQVRFNKSDVQFCVGETTPLRNTGNTGVQVRRAAGNGVHGTTVAANVGFSNGLPATKQGGTRVQRRANVTGSQTIGKQRSHLMIVWREGARVMAGPGTHHWSCGEKGGGWALLRTGASVQAGVQVPGRRPVLDAPCTVHHAPGGGHHPNHTTKQ